jgi:splicing factor U2AF 35 kDa subunit
MVSNVYAQFREEEQAAAALRGRYYSARPIIAEFSPVTDFREATCRQFEENVCNRGGYCNFMHVKKVSRDLRRRLFGHVHRSRRSYSPYRYRSRDRDEEHDYYRHYRSSSSRRSSQSCWR